MKPARLRRRRLADRLFTLAATACGIGTAVLLVGIVGSIVVRALPALDLDFLTRQMSAAGAGGGVRYQILGTLILMATALVVSLPLAWGLALVETVYLPPGRLRAGLSLWLYAANGVPSIVVGIFGLMLFGHLLTWGKSWLAGGILLGLMILPTLTVALVERIEAIPAKYLEAARGLGLGRSQTVWAVILPQSVSGLYSGALLGLARAGGETAPILFTAAVFAGATIPRGVADSPVLALPYHIFVLAQDSFQPASEARLWGAALVLLVLVLGLSLLALPARLAAHEEAKHG